MWLACVVIGSLWTWQLVSGNFYGGNWRVWLTRRERPGAYWASMGVQAVMLAIAIRAASTAH